MWIDWFSAGWFGIIVGRRLYRGRSDVSYASVACHTVHAAKPASLTGKGIASFAKRRIFFDTAAAIVVVIVGIIVEW